MSHLLTIHHNRPLNNHSLAVCRNYYLECVLECNKSNTEKQFYGSEGDLEISSSVPEVMSVQGPRPRFQS